MVVIALKKSVANWGRVNGEDSLKHGESLTEYPLNAGSQATKNCDAVISGGLFQDGALNLPR